MNVSIRNSLISYGMAFIEINETLGNEITYKDINKALLKLTETDTNPTGEITPEILSASNGLARILKDPEGENIKSALKELSLHYSDREGFRDH